MVRWRHQWAGASSGGPPTQAAKLRCHIMRCHIMRCHIMRCHIMPCPRQSATALNVITPRMLCYHGFRSVWCRMYHKSCCQTVPAVASLCMAGNLLRSCTGSAPEDAHDTQQPKHDQHEGVEVNHGQ